MTLEELRKMEKEIIPEYHKAQRHSANCEAAFLVARGEVARIRKQLTDYQDAISKLEDEKLRRQS